MGLSRHGDSILVQPDIIDVRVGAIFRLDRLDGMGALENRHFCVWVEKISEYPCASRTGLDTGWFEPDIDPVGAERTFLNNLLDRMHIPHRIRTCHHTISTSNTGMGIDDHNAIFPLERGFGGAYGDATRVVTVITQDRQERFPHMGIKSLFDFFHPGGPYTKRNPVFHLTGDFTGVTTDTTAKVYDHAIFDLGHGSSQEQFRNRFLFTPKYNSKK